MRPYEKPTLNEFGPMDSVTQKSGPNWDGENQTRSPGDPPPDWFCEIFWWLEICGGPGIGGASQRGTGSF